MDLPGPWQCPAAMLCIAEKVFQDNFYNMQVLIQWRCFPMFFHRMTFAGNEPFAGSVIGPEGWQCDISMLRLSGGSILDLSLGPFAFLRGMRCFVLLCYWLCWPSQCLQLGRRMRGQIDVSVYFPPAKLEFIVLFCSSGCI